MHRMFADSVEKEPFEDRVMENNLEHTKTESVVMKSIIEVLNNKNTLIIIKGNDLKVKRL